MPFILGLVTLASLALTPLDLPEPRETCATSPATQAAVEALDRYVARQTPAARVQANAIAPAAAGDGFVILPADDINTPFNRRFDLAGRSISFALQSDGTYASANVPLQFDADTGAALDIPPSERFAPYTLAKFALPFFDRTVTQLYVSRTGALFTAPPAEAVGERYDALEASGLENGTIAPLLHVRLHGGSIPTVHAKELDDRAVFTWLGGGEQPIAFQATLFRNGNIVYSYAQVDPSTEGAVVLSKGALPRQPLATHDDASGDVTTIAALPAAVAPSLDIRSVSVSRLADLDLLEVRLTMAQPLAWDMIPPSYYATFEVAFDGRPLTYLVYGDGFEDAYLPVRSMTYGTSTAARVEGSTIVFRIDQDYLTLDREMVTVTARTAYSTSGAIADSVTFPVELRAAQKSFEFDLSANGARASDLLVEAFTIPGFNPAGAWRQLKARYGLNDADVDGVAFYQNFVTDIRATAYSTVGNSGADGVWMNGYSSSARPKSPALLHMNRLGRTHQSTLLHELGHRWLFWIDFVAADGTRSAALNALSHPKETVHTSAAFGEGLSPMGGRHWNDNGNGTFTAVPRPRPGYSWIELYLMGLAAPSEVQQLFYLEGADRIGNTVTATRRDVTIDQIVAAIGSRVPSYANAQKKFNMLFVLIADTHRPVTAAEMQTMSTNSRTFPETFRTATGNRGEITLLEPQTAPVGPRRRSVRH